MKVLAIVECGPMLRAALANQSFTDWEIVSDIGNVGTRSYLISASDETMARALSTRGMLLYWMIRMEIDLLGLLALESSGGGYAGAILSCGAFEYHEHVPRHSGLIADLIDHARSVGIRVGSIVVTDEPVAAPVEPAGSAWRIGIPSSKGSEPPAKPDLFTCSTNDLYGSASVMRAYAGVREMLPIVGRLQHGWEPGPGIVLEATDDAGFDRYYVWTALALDRLRLMRIHEPEIADPAERTALIRERLSRVKLIPIGAPYLYLPDLADPGPVAKDWLLAVPGHGIAASANRVHPWADYLGAVRRFANEREFDRVTVLVYAEDDNPAARQAIEEAGMRPATCGRVGDVTYMCKVRSFIRQHAAVTSDRVCTAGMYALYENRPFYIVGAGTVVHEPPDAYAELVADPVWIARHYPSIWAGGLTGREEALLELGKKLPPETLRRALYYWVWE